MEKLAGLSEDKWQNYEVKLKHSWAELKLLLASRRLHKTRKLAAVGSSEEEAALGHTQEQFLVRHSW
jgi:hypothetical protein